MQQLKGGLVGFPEIFPNSDRRLVQEFDGPKHENDF
jgi:hypothetical protein